MIEAAGTARIIPHHPKSWFPKSKTRTIPRGCISTLQPRMYGASQMASRVCTMT
jgi:hypothetical protein